MVHTPFMAHILEAELSLTFVRFELIAYNGTADPNVFITNYEYNLLKRGCCQVHMCKLFLGYIKGAAIDWFSKFPSKGISNF